jgi:tetratricopeptide (TPR) repeat protein
MASSDFAQQLSAAFLKHQAGDVDGAVALYRDVLAHDPKQADALHMLGVAAKQKGNPQLALNLIEAALGARSDLPFGWHNRSLVLRLLGRTQDALLSSQQAVALDPKHAEAWNTLALLTRETSDFAKAMAAHAKAMELRPQDMRLRAEYALTLYAVGDLKNAHKVMWDALQKDANVSPLTLANVLKSAGYPERAIPYFQRASELMPENADIKVSEAMAHFQIGDYALGWPLWETRSDLDNRYSHISKWLGNAVDHLLLYEDQGVGDAIQFARYIPMLQIHAKHVTLHVTSVLCKLFTGNFPAISVLSSDRSIPAADACMRLSSLPAWHKTVLETVPSAVPYLRASEEWCVPWRHRLAPIAQPRIGIVWGGNPDNHNDRKRSVPFAQLAPVVEVGAGHLVSLQKGGAKTQADLSATRIFDAEPYLDDFAATAGLLAELDLIITVCTSPAHLAGAMGRPGWVILCFDPHWPWLLEREDSPWYPSLRLFRQASPGDWTPVMAHVAEELKKFIAGDRSVLKPKPWTGSPVRQNIHAVDLTEN